MTQVIVSQGRTASVDVLNAECTAPSSEIHTDRNTANMNEVGRGDQKLRYLHVTHGFV